MALAVFVSSLLWLAGGIDVGVGGNDTPPFHIDEAHKLAETFYYHLFIEQRAPDHPAWTQDFYARTNPPVAKYVFGAVLAVGGYHVRDQQLQDDFERFWRTPAELRKRVPDGMLRITRHTSAVFGALICMLLFVMGRRVGGTAAGLVAVVLLLGNPFFQRYAQRGLTDTILMFHLALIVPVAMWAAGVRKRAESGTAAGPVRRGAALLVRMVVVPGLVVALAAGSKLNGALAGGVYALALLLTTALHRETGRRWRRVSLAGAMVVLAAVLAVGLFVAINPYYYDQPMTRAGDVMRVYHDWMIKQQLDPGAGVFDGHQKAAASGYFTLRSPLLPLAQYLGTLGTWLTVLGFAVGVVYLIGRSVPGGVPHPCPAGGFSRSRGKGEGPSAPDSSPFAGRSVPHPPTRSGESRIALENGAPTAVREPSPSAADAVIVLCWIAVCVVVITAWLPVAWHRYLLPVYAAVCLATAIGLANLPGGVFRIVDALGGAREERGGLRIVLGLAATVVLWGVLGLASWPITPTLLDPSVFPEAARDLTVEQYVDAVTARPESVALRRNLGWALLARRMPKLAAREFETALSSLGRGPAEQADSGVQRCCLLYDLARAHALSGNRIGAVEAIRRHAAGVEKLRDGMTSTDPKVRAGYSQVIADHQRVLAGMLRGQRRGAQRSTGKPGPHEPQREGN